MADIIFHSFKRCRNELCEDITGETLEHVPLGQCERVVRMVVVRPEVFPSPVENIVRRLQDVGLQLDVYNCKKPCEQPSYVDPPKQLGEPLTVLCNDVERALKKLQYAYREGDVFKRQPGSKFTYSRLCTMDSFLNSLLGNAHFKDRLLTYMSKLQSILRHPDCQAITQIEVDRDLVEVNDGWCWSFHRRKFGHKLVKNHHEHTSTTPTTKNPIQSTSKGS